MPVPFNAAIDLANPYNIVEVAGRHVRGRPRQTTRAVCSLGSR